MLKTTLFGAAGVSGTPGLIVVEDNTSYASIYDRDMSYDGQGGVSMLYYAPSYPSSVHLLKFSSSGILQFGRVLQSNFSPEGRSICNSPDGDTFIVGNIRYISTSDYYHRGFIVKYSSSGSLLWQKFTSWAVDTGGLDIVFSDKSSSSLYALGVEMSNGRLLCKFDSQTGGITSAVWLYSISGNIILGDTDSLGNVYIVSENIPTITKITPTSLAASWCYQFTIGDAWCYVQDLVVDGNNNVYVALVSDPYYYSPTSTFILVKMSTSGVIQWSKGFTVNSYRVNCSAARGISVSSSGHIYLTCKDISGPKVQYITKFSQDGTVLWQREVRCDLDLTTNSRAAVVGDTLWSSYTILASGQTLGLVLSTRVDGSTLGSYAAGSYATVTYSSGTRSISDVSNLSMTKLSVNPSQLYLPTIDGTLTSQTSGLTYTSYNFS